MNKIIASISTLLIILISIEANAKGSYRSKGYSNKSYSKSYSKTYKNYKKQTYVKGYYKKNGTFVKPHYRTTPNKNKLDNWSTKGNINPYTGKLGTVNPFKIK